MFNRVIPLNYGESHVNQSVKMTIFILMIMSMVTCKSANGFVVCQDGQAKAVIVVAKGCDAKTQSAANDLQAILEKMSGAKLSIVTDDTSPDGNLILVGKNKLTDQLGIKIPSGLTPNRQEEGFVIVCKDNYLVLAGNNEGPYHGTEYAVYDFLHRLGCRWYMPGEYGEVIPKQKNVTLADFTVEEKPDFKMRNWWMHFGPGLAEPEKLWKIRNKMNPDPIFNHPADSSARELIPEKVYFKSHPEYYAKNPDGTRNPYLPSLSNPDAVKVAAQTIKDYFKNNPESNSYGFSPDDGLPRDYDPESMKLNQGFCDLLGRPGVAAEQSITEEWLTFANNVTKEVRKEYPDKYIAVNGYANRNLPPQGVELDDHMGIMFAAIWCCPLHAFDDPHCWQKVRQGQMLQQWCKVAKNVWIYGYNFQMLATGLTPLPETRKLRRDFPLLKKWGVAGFFDESRNIWAEAGIASRYLRSRLEWNANADVDAILNEYYQNWYGKAASTMQAFYNLIEDSIEKTAMHGHEDRIMPEVYGPDLVDKLSKLISKAETLADTEPYKTHVQADRLIYEHLKAYMDMHAAEFDARYADAVNCADRMMQIRGKLHAINPFYIWNDENGYHTGIFYWGIEKRKQYYQKLADMTSGKTGELIALLPKSALFRTDKYDEGIASEWYQPTSQIENWKKIDITRPFYIQGYEDPNGYPYLGTIWYRFDVDVPAAIKNKKVILYAATLVPEGWCWVNGNYAAHRPYRESWERPQPMEVDITRFIKPGQKNTIVLRIYTHLSPTAVSEGLQSRVFLYTPKEK